jgi:hypothetical protein
MSAVVKPRAEHTGFAERSAGDGHYWQAAVRLRQATFKDFLEYKSKAICLAEHDLSICYRADSLVDRLLRKYAGAQGLRRKLSRATGLRQLVTIFGGARLYDAGCGDDDFHQIAD